MSLQDLETFGPSLAAVYGRKFLLTVAANSLKLRFDAEDHRRTYLWVDPPWLLQEPTSRVVRRSSELDSLPFETFAEAMDRIRGAALLATERNQSQTRFRFDNGYVLISVDTHDEREEVWYQDFYFKD